MLKASDDTTVLITHNKVKFLASTLLSMSLTVLVICRYSVLRELLEEIEMLEAQVLVSRQISQS